MAKLPEIKEDMTLLDIDKALEYQQSLEGPRHYMGMSAIGDECLRKSFYSFRNVTKRVIPASGLKAIQDGFLQEDVMADRLRMLPYIELHTKDPANPEKQIGFSLLLDHFRGHCDGMIKGIKEAPLTWHVWEHKSVNEKKFNTLVKLKQEHGEKKALSEWDTTYFKQAMIYMHCSQTTRHYLTVTTPGGRAYTSCRTEYNKLIAESTIDCAQSVIFDNATIPAKLSDKREFYKCKWCDYSEVCHDGKFPLVHCKTCQYSEPVNDGKRKCNWKDEIIDETHLHLDGCAYHLYNPALIDAKLVEQKNDYCIYETANNSLFANCILSGMPPLDIDIVDMYTSKDLYSKIQFVGNIKKELLQVQKKFDGSFQEKSPAKLWENKKDAKLFDI